MVMEKVDSLTEGSNVWRSTSFSCSSNRFRRRNSRNSADSPIVLPGVAPSSMSPLAHRRRRHLPRPHRAFKGGWGFHLLMAWCDYSGELSAIIASRSGFAGILMHLVGPGAHISLKGCAAPSEQPGE